MTHGEMWFKRKKEIEYKNFNDVGEIYGIPNRMSRKEALRYYNKKLALYWKKKKRSR